MTNAHPEDPPIELRGVSIAFTKPSGETQHIVRDLSFTLQPGRIHCLAGRSGSGKTSIIAVAAGLAKPMRGSVRWYGTKLDVWNDDDISRQRNQHIGYTDQRATMLTGLTTIENVLLPAVPQRKTRTLQARAAELLDQLGLADRIHHRPDTLSGGERQRAALARALLLAPPILIVDEPTSGLDRAAADSVIDLLTDQATSGTAILVASHDAHLIARADNTTVLEEEPTHTNRAADTAIT